VFCSDEHDGSVDVNELVGGAEPVGEGVRFRVVPFAGWEDHRVDVERRTASEVRERACDLCADSVHGKEVDAVTDHRDVEANDSPS
jgi:hypothetical protein